MSRPIHVHFIIEKNEKLEIEIRLWYKKNIFAVFNDTSINIDEKCKVCHLIKRTRGKVLLNYEKGQIDALVIVK